MGNRYASFNRPFLRYIERPPATRAFQFRVKDTQEVAAYLGSDTVKIERHGGDEGPKVTFTFAEIRKIPVLVVESGDYIVSEITNGGQKYSMISRRDFESKYMLEPEEAEIPVIEE